MSTEIEQLLAIVDQAFERKSWHGTNLRGSLRGVDARQALWRPGRDRHNIWELTVHCAYWKYIVRRRLTGGKRGAFPLQGSDWFVPEETTEAAWRDAVELLVTTHRSLRDVIAALDPGRLRRPAGGSRDRAFDLIAGVAAHDLYHAGQIQLVKRLHSGR